MGVLLAATSRVVVRSPFDDRKNAHCQQNLTLFQLCFLQFCRYGSFGGHCSFAAERSRLPRRGRTRGSSGLWNALEGWSRSTLHCENRAVQGSGKFSRGLVGVGESSRKDTRRTEIQCVGNASDDPETATKFFFDELMEANLNMEKLAEQKKSADSTQPWQTQEEAKSQQRDIATRKKSPEKDAESGDSDWQLWRGHKTKGREKLPMESNGPPMVILQPYLALDNKFREEEAQEEKLRRLPFPEPHKLHPPGLPRPSLRRRLGLAHFRKSIPAGQVSEFISRPSSED